MIHEISPSTMRMQGREEWNWGLLVFLTCNEYDVAGNERAMFSTTSVDIRNSIESRDKVRVQSGKSRKQKRIEVEEGGVY
jgi:hypothetical protein